MNVIYLCAFSLSRFYIFSSLRYRYKTLDSHQRSGECGYWISKAFRFTFFVQLPWQSSSTGQRYHLINVSISDWSSFSLRLPLTDQANTRRLCCEIFPWWIKVELRLILRLYSSVAEAEGRCEHEVLQHIRPFHSSPSPFIRWIWCHVHKGEERKIPKSISRTISLRFVGEEERRDH